MHPVIRIVCYLVLAVFLARANVAQLLFSALGLSVLLLVAPPTRFASRLARALYRLKWLFLSIVVLYLWFTPPGASMGGGDGAMPAGLGMGLLRVAVLIMLIWGVLFLMHGMSRAQLLGAIYLLLQPLGRLGVPADRFALRLSLTLQAVNELQAQPAPAQQGEPRASKWQRISARVNAWFDWVRDRAESCSLEPQALPEILHPPIWQWTYPIMLIGVFVALRFVDLAVWF